MCLLDEVLAWDRETILCLTHSHRNRDNPLREANRLHSIHAVEYGAQAMAVHGGLLAREADNECRAGLLVSLRNIKLRVDRLDLIESPLLVSATQLMAEAGNLLYHFALREKDSIIASGKVAVMAFPERNR
jgi:predicted hotdog family 3-hydroxylacyl-ACP dehydratase